MKNGYFQIGEVSRITGLSKNTLHFFHYAGLNFVWFTFAVAETIAVFACIGLYKAAKPAFNGRQAENGKAGAL